MSKGWVYILTNEAMPGLVKIGKTTRSVEGRAHELYQTGVPSPFVIAAKVFAPDCHQLEAEMHAVMAEYRVNLGREFFQLPVDDAIAALEEEHRAQVGDWLNHFMPDHSAIHWRRAVSEEHIARLAEEGGVDFEVICDVMSEVSLDELAPASKRIYDRLTAPEKGEE